MCFNSGRRSAVGRRGTYGGGGGSTRRWHVATRLPAAAQPRRHPLAPRRDATWRAVTWRDAPWRDASDSDASDIVQLSVCDVCDVQWRGARRQCSTRGDAETLSDWIRIYNSIFLFNAISLTVKKRCNDDLLLGNMYCIICS